MAALPPLAFDHREIIRQAHERLVARLDDSDMAFQLLAESFTLPELQQLYETLLDGALDKRTVRKWANALEQIEETGETRPGGSHRPVRVYRLKHRDRVDLTR
jgi:8-oxo-dGTP diphosphatase